MSYRVGDQRRRSHVSILTDGASASPGRSPGRPSCPTPTIAHHRQAARTPLASDPTSTDPFAPPFDPTDVTGAMANGADFGMSNFPSPAHQSSTVSNVGSPNPAPVCRTSSRISTISRPPRSRASPSPYPFAPFPTTALRRHRRPGRPCRPRTIRWMRTAAASRSTPPAPRTCSSARPATTADTRIRRAGSNGTRQHPQRLPVQHRDQPRRHHDRGRRRRHRRRLFGRSGQGRHRRLLERAIRSKRRRQQSLRPDGGRHFHNRRKTPISLLSPATSSRRRLSTSTATRCRLRSRRVSRVTPFLPRWFRTAADPRSSASTPAPTSSRRSACGAWPGSPIRSSTTCSAGSFPTNEPFLTVYLSGSFQLPSKVVLNPPPNPPLLPMNKYIDNIAVDKRRRSDEASLLPCLARSRRAVPRSAAAGRCHAESVHAAGRRAHGVRYRARPHHLLGHAQQRHRLARGRDQRGLRLHQGQRPHPLRGEEGRRSRADLGLAGAGRRSAHRLHRGRAALPDGQPDQQAGDHSSSRRRLRRRHLLTFTAPTVGHPQVSAERRQSDETKWNIGDDCRHRIRIRARRRPVRVRAWIRTRQVVPWTCSSAPKAPGPARAPPTARRWQPTATQQARRIEQVHGEDARDAVALYRRPVHGEPEHAHHAEQHPRQPELEDGDPAESEPRRLHHLQPAESAPQGADGGEVRPAHVRAFTVRPGLRDLADPGRLPADAGADQHGLWVRADPEPADPPRPQHRLVPDEQQVPPARMPGRRRRICLQPGDACRRAQTYTHLDRPDAGAYDDNFCAGRRRPRRQLHARRRGLQAQEADRPAGVQRAGALSERLRAPRTAPPTRACTPALDFYNEYVWSSRGGTQEVKHTYATSYDEVYTTTVDHDERPGPLLQRQTARRGSR